MSVCGLKSKKYLILSSYFRKFLYILFKERRVWGNGYTRNTAELQTNIKSL